MKTLIIILFVTLTSIINAQKLEFVGQHSRTEGDKKFIKETSLFQWDVKKEQIVFLTENGFQILYKIKGIKSDDSSEQFVSIYFLTTCGQLVSLYYEDGTTTCMIVIGAKTYSGEIVSFE